ncbi:hypothetical protein PF011_g10044 [Phytophthora fragariae]|uniref:Uncharacterized protein n=1 Tax=Phytophthora fragariae TaxID=53985 RepID=A0A6A3KWI7_9STRA|nr:hypothetical protein PF011_g10044 [Phytophthora fragariae]
MTTDTETRDERAQWRAASAGRAAAEAARSQKESAPVTLNTDDGGTVTLEASVITSASGGPPLGSAGAGHERGQADGNGGRPTGGGTLTGCTSTDGATTLTDDSSGRRGDGHDGGGHGNDGGRGGRAGQREATLDVGGGYDGVTGTGGGSGGVRPGRPANPQPGPAAGPARARTAAAPIVVREKVKTLKLTKFKGLNDTMPVSM